MIVGAQIYLDGEVGKLLKIPQQLLIMFGRLRVMGDQRNDGGVIDRSDFPDVNVRHLIVGITFHGLPDRFYVFPVIVFLSSRILLVSLSSP